MEINWDLTEKQELAWNFLKDNKTTEILFGGAAGGGKSVLGCAWLIIMCGVYPETRWLLGRAKLKELKQTTLKTFFEICGKWNIRNGVHYTYNAIDSFIRFSNGSEIFLKDLFLYPSDPNFDNLGSLEITGAFIDECSQINIKAKNIVGSRIRYKLDEYDLIPKMLMTCNPTKSWPYVDFYKPNKDKILPNYKVFVQSLVSDNPFISPHYIENLKKLDKNSRERLLYGNWEYDDDPARLFEMDTLTDLFTNIVVDHKKKREPFYLSVDVARKGSDKTVIMVWNGLQVIKTITIPVCTIDEIVRKLEELTQEYQIRRSFVVVDEDGVGGGVVDNFRGCKGFINNAKPLQPREYSTHIKLTDSHLKKQNFLNLKSQCYFKLAQLAEMGQIGISNSDDNLKMTIIEELEQIKQDDIDKDGKLRVISKDKIKEVLGRSCDYADSLMMRMYYEVLKKKEMPLDEKLVGKNATLSGNLFNTNF